MILAAEEGKGEERGERREERGERSGEWGEETGRGEREREKNQKIRSVDGSWLPPAPIMCVWGVSPLSIRTHSPDRRRRRRKERR